jgi:acyl dehydratase
LLSTITHTVLIRGERPAPSAGSTSTGTASSLQTRPATSGAAQPPASLPTQTYEVTMLDLLRYSGATGEFGPTHWSDRGARAAGLPGTIAHGMFLMTKAAQALGTWICDPARITDFAVRFSAPFLVTEDWPGTMTVAASAVEQLDDGGTRIHLDVRDGSGSVLLTRASAVITGDLD